MYIRTKLMLELSNVADNSEERYIVVWHVPLQITA